MTKPVPGSGVGAVGGDVVESGRVVVVVIVVVAVAVVIVVVLVVVVVVVVVVQGVFFKRSRPKSSKCWRWQNPY